MVLAGCEAHSACRWLVAVKQRAPRVTRDVVVLIRVITR